MVIASISLIAGLVAVLGIVVLSGGDSTTSTVAFAQNVTNSTGQNATNATAATVTDKVHY
jgi:hypothetical protein